MFFLKTDRSKPSGHYVGLKLRTKLAFSWTLVVLRDFFPTGFAGFPHAPTTRPSVQIEHQNFLPPISPIVLEACMDVTGFKFMTTISGTSSFENTLILKRCFWGILGNNTYQDPQLDQFYGTLRLYWAEAEGFGEDEPQPSEEPNPDEDDDGYVSAPQSDSEPDQEAKAAEPQVENGEVVTEPMPEVSEGGEGENPAAAATNPIGDVKGDLDEVTKTSPTETIQEPVVTETVAPAEQDPMPPPPVPKKGLLDSIPKGNVTSQDRENVKRRIEELKLLGGKGSNTCFSFLIRTSSVLWWIKCCLGFRFKTLLGFVAHT